MLRDDDLEKGHEAARRLWGKDVMVIDPMAGGGSIPLESARLGFRTLANEYNPVACSILEATVDYPFRLGEKLVQAARNWGGTLRERFNARMQKFYPSTGFLPAHTYIFARTVPCPDTGFPTPLVPDWHLVKPKNHSDCGEQCWFAVPVVDRKQGSWTIRVQQGGRRAGQAGKAPPASYSGGKGVSLFSGRMVDGVWQGRPIPADYIKAMAQQGKMKRALYAVVIKTASGLRFAPPEPADLKALEAAEKELARLRPGWEKANIIPTETYPEVTSDERPSLYGMPRWADMFSPRQLLCMGVLVEELGKLRPEIVKAEGEELGEAVVHLLAFALSKMANYNSGSSFWHPIRGTMANTFDRHDFSFKLTHAEMAVCNAGAGLAWAIENVIEPYEKIAKLPRDDRAGVVEISMGSATTLAQVADRSITAVVIDPPYADNVQYSELADFFYVWLKRTQGHRRPEWFSTYLCEHDQEAVVNVSRFKDGQKKTKDARAESHLFYQKLMTDTFKECRRILRDDGVLTVMFTHKKQEAWEALFKSLIDAGFTITATWPVKTESEHSLHQAKKNAAQSTVILVGRKRPGGAGVGYFDATMRQEIHETARRTAERLEGEGLNRVDQLVGSFGPAMAVYSRYDQVKTDVGKPVEVAEAIDEASDAVVAWRIEQLAARGLEGVEAEGQFYLLCWDVLGAAELRFNEAKLLGHAVGMDVDHLIVAGLVAKSGDKIKILPARDRRRGRALEPDEVSETLYGPVTVPKKRRKQDVRKVHPNDPQFRTALDGCHAVALRYLEAGSAAGGIGTARGLIRQQGWKPGSAVAKLMEALVRAAPEAVKFEKGKTSAAAKFPEFRAWHALLKPLFDIEPPDWTEKALPQGLLALPEPEEEELEDEQVEDEEGAEEDEE